MEILETTEIAGRKARIVQDADSNELRIVYGLLPETIGILVYAVATFGFLTWSLFV